MAFFRMNFREQIGGAVVETTTTTKQTSSSSSGLALGGISGKTPSPPQQQPGQNGANHLTNMPNPTRIPAPNR